MPKPVYIRGLGFCYCLGVTEILYTFLKQELSLIYRLAEDWSLLFTDEMLRTMILSALREDKMAFR